MSPRKISFIDQPSLPFEDFDDTPVFCSGEESVSSIPSDEFDDKAHKVIPPNELDEIDDKEYKVIPPINFISFGSGSSGNSCYIGNEDGGVIIDAGIRTDIVEDTLRKYKVPMSKVKGVLLTHDHSDHIRFVYNLVRTHRHLRLYCTNRVLNGVLRRHNVSKRIKEYHIAIFKEIPFKLAGFEITAFDVPHDGTDNMGFSLNYGGRNFVLATDLGAIYPRAKHYITQANYLVLEANYDSDMLKYGPYPEYLKQRIRTDYGHMDNVATASFLSEIINPSLSHIFLCHLSKDNNTPEKALTSVKSALERVGKTVGSAMDLPGDYKCDVQVMTLPRFDPTRWFILR